MLTVTTGPWCFSAVGSALNQLQPTSVTSSSSYFRLLENLSGEIVYPCILDPDGEDEGGQASSSLAISTRWISAAKLLQSDLATLAQREENRRWWLKL
ncbi:hypothetical protein BHM03_00057025 [Ensete ventricosum]|nr:hypothetical protein BHM03_00057025 [Ensete ventricosum]